MKTMIRNVVAAVALMSAGAAWASGSQSNSGVEEVVPAFTADCWAYTNEPIRQMGGSVVEIGENGIDVQGPDDPYSEQDGETAHFSPSIYDVNGIDFYASTVIKFAVLKSGNRVAVLRYVPQGEYTATYDSGMQVYVPPSDSEPEPLPIDTVNLCYAGDPDSVPPPPAPTIPQCSSCTGAGVDPVLVCGIPLDQPYFGGGTNECCVCNSPALPRCNPAGLGGTPSSCVGDGTGAKTGLKVPTIIEFNKDPYVCSTTGGTRSCYRY